MARIARTTSRPRNPCTTRAMTLNFAQNDAVDSRPVVYLYDTFHSEAIAYCKQLFRTVGPEDPEYGQWRQRAKYLLIRKSPFTAEDVASCANLRAIGKQGVGIDKIDTKACEARGIKILNTPGVNAGAVAELVLALVMTLAREIPTIYARLHQGEVVPREACSGLILRKKTVGIIGMGNIGEAVARLFHGAFDAHIIAYGRSQPESAWSDIPHTRASTVEEVLRAADVLSVHVPLAFQTRDLITYRELSMMKPTAILINTARGGIVNEDDLARGLRDNLIWAAGLDCHEQDPPIVSTPHIGAATTQTQQETAIAAVQRLYDYVQSLGDSYL
ncbi:hypothetical protein LCI18_013711 [Fusarium solani-melongenae]|uniref:Uncharacterized protein n=1 Tax=Fusarium solani subsp. cucurbitae TaxID=2747967 RepID=A0ACD3ZNI8_FUSSC|nr:hypothetical protein LCI18_013711 [Fusarium solani-melongenae]